MCHNFFTRSPLGRLSLHALAAAGSGDEIGNHRLEFPISPVFRISPKNTRRYCRLGQCKYAVWAQGGFCKSHFPEKKIVSLQAPRPKNLRFLAETGEGGRKAENPLGFQVSPLAKLPTAQIEDLRRGTWRGACFPVHQLVKTFLTSIKPLFERRAAFSALN